MNTRRIITAVSALTVAAGLAVMTTAATAAPSPAATDTLPTMDAALITQDADGYQGKWKITGGTVEDSFEMDGETISNGSTSLRAGVPANDVISFGFVGGFTDPETGVSYAQLSGQAGSDVTSVRIVSASGVTTEARLADGVWGAVWLAGDNADEYGNAQIQVTTLTGTETVSTDEVDVIAADQRAADQN